MLKKTMLGILALLCCFVGVALFAGRDPAPKGEGSFKDAEKIIATLQGLSLETDSEDLPEEYYKLGVEGGLTYIVTGTNSHGAGGGTMGFKLPDGSIHVYFGHVCGPGPTPLELRGDTKEEILAGMSKEWRKHK